MADTQLSVSQEVAGLQFDLLTLGTVTMYPVGKTLDTSVITGGYRCLIYSIDTVTFSGRFAHVSAPVTGISNVYASDVDGNQLDGTSILLFIPSDDIMVFAIA